jgi:glycosyltransferase involved in cell wall biosynthesis
MTEAAAVRELVARVIGRGGAPIDRWEAAVAIESGESMPAAAPGAPPSGASVFELADALYAECLERRAQRPEVTVAMPAHNRAALIGDAIRSVLAQDDIALELIVVDDGSDDDTAAVAASFADPRIVVLRNPVRRGVGYCHNQVVAQSRAPFIAHVDSDDLVVPGGLRKVVDRLAASTDFGQAHGQPARVGADGSVERDELRQRWRDDVDRRHGFDYREALLRRGSVMNPLRVYRREIFDIAGGFDETLRHGIDLEMALRILDTHEIVAVPDVVYCVRLHRGRLTSLRFPRQRFWVERVLMIVRLRRRGALSYTRTRRYRASRMLSGALAGALGLTAAAATVRGMVRWGKSRVTAAARRFLRAANRLAYRSVSRSLARWPAPRRRVAVTRGAAPPKVVYFLWRYPVASELFIRRELAALSRLGIAVAVVAEEPADQTIDLDGAPAALLLRELAPEPFEELLRGLLLRRPWRLLSLASWVLGLRHGANKSWSEDLALLEKAARLAVALERLGATRVHSPWADRSALIARLAAALQRMPYSAQARAHELHRERFRIGLGDRLSGAEFVVCGAEYVRDHRLSFLASSRVPIHLVREGLQPARFEPRPRRQRCPREPLRVLTVARLIEEKGIVHLLAAAAELRRRGVAVAWRVVGGPEEPASTNYLLEVRRLHRRLGLDGVVELAGSLAFERVTAEYDEADVFVLPCVEARNGGRDVTPNSVIEAMAMELPVVSSRQTAIPELAPDGECSILVEPGDVGALADAVARLGADEELRRALGARGRARVRRLFDVDRNAAELARLFSGQPAGDRG